MVVQQTFPVDTPMRATTFKASSHIPRYVGGPELRCAVRALVLVGLLMAAVATLMALGLASTAPAGPLPTPAPQPSPVANAR